MPSFANPFQGNVNRKMTREELIQAVRLDIAGELEAIYLYDAHVQATDDPRAKAVIGDIRDEEKVHVGELLALLQTLDPQEAVGLAEGRDEVSTLLAQTGAEKPAPDLKAESMEQQTVGSLLHQ